MFRFNVPDMSCGHCAGRITDAIRSIDPSAQVEADPPSREVKITTRADEQALIAALVDAGYPPEPRDPSTVA